MPVVVIKAAGGAPFIAAAPQLADMQPSFVCQRICALLYS
jgi:hypothetical protein